MLIKVLRVHSYSTLHSRAVKQKYVFTVRILFVGNYARFGYRSAISAAGLSFCITCHAVSVDKVAEREIIGNYQSRRGTACVSSFAFRRNRSRWSHGARRNHGKWTLRFFSPINRITRPSCPDVTCRHSACYISFPWSHVLENLNFMLVALLDLVSAARFFKSHLWALQLLMELVTLIYQDTLLSSRKNGLPQYLEQTTIENIKKRTLTTSLCGLHTENRQGIVIGIDWSVYEIVNSTNYCANMSASCPVDQYAKKHLDYYVNLIVQVNNNFWCVARVSKAD